MLAQVGTKGGQNNGCYNVQVVSAAGEQIVVAVDPSGTSSPSWCLPADSAHQRPFKRFLVPLLAASSPSGVSGVGRQTVP
jgi:hypothetical protein